MNFATFWIEGKRHWGAVNEHGIIPLDHHFPNWPGLKEVILDNGLDKITQKAKDEKPQHVAYNFDIPILNPGKIICVGVNFPDRNEEYKDGQAAQSNPSLFVRFPESFTGHGRPLIRPPESPQLDYEGEMAIVIGRPGRRISEQDAHQHIAALTICNEGTIRDWVRHAKFNVTQGKNWNHSGSIGPWIVPFTDRNQIENAMITTRVNGELRQQDNTSRMIFPIRKQIAYISTFTTLMPGDIIVTGTPTGAGARMDPPTFLKPGDLVEVEVSGIGTLKNTIEDEQC